jgi:acetyl-CoA carboxylase biotin carboxyl carrier protein
MEFKQIQELLKAVNKSNISVLKIKDGDFEITIKQHSEIEHAQVITAPVYQAAPIQPVAPQQPVAVAAPLTPATTPAENTNTITIKSPMIGTFYRSSSPDKPPFVSVGDEIQVGQVLCIVEAMKLFNEIESEVSGKIVKVLIDDASPVEYDQPLFLVEPI